jgi:hypothetical protein
MNQNSGAMNSGSMLKTGDQPRASSREVSDMNKPASMSYIRSQPRGATLRTNQSRSMKRS